MYSNSIRPVTNFSVFPPVLKNLLIINGLFFLAQNPADSPVALFLREWFALWPIDAPDQILTRQGLRATGDFWPWQLVTYGFLHGDLMHILFNMFALWMFGVQIENAWGSRRFAIFYFVCVIGAGLIQLATSVGQGYYTVGASGGVYGILLAFGMMFPNNEIFLLFLPFPIKAKWFVLGLGVFAIFGGFTGAASGTAHFAHLGGMVFGFLLIQYWRGKMPIKPAHGRLF